MHNSPLHLRCVATLRRTHYQPNRHVVFLSWWLADHEWWEKLTTDEFQYSLKFQVLTDVSVAHLPHWTWRHQQDHILCSTRNSRFAAPCRMSWYLPSFSSLWTLRSFQLFMWKFFRQLLCSSLSLRFNGHFPGKPGLASVYWSKGWWRWRW